MSSQEIERLKQRVKCCNNSIVRNANDADAYYLKGVAYEEWFKCTKDSNRIIAALECYDKAVEITKSDNVLYLSARGKLHVTMGNHDAAVLDAATAAKAMTLFPPTSGVEVIYTQNTLQDIVILTEVRDSIAKLKLEGQISEPLADILEKHAKVTSHLVVQVDAQEKRIDFLEEEVRNLKDIVQHLQQSQSESDIKIADVEKKYEALKVESEKYRNSLTTTQEQLQKISDALALNQNEIDAIHYNISALELAKKESDKILGFIIENMPELKKLISFSKISTERRQELEKLFIGVNGHYNKAFYNHFTDQLKMVYFASMAICSGLVPSEVPAALRILGGISTGLSGIPVVGSVIGVVGGSAIYVASEIAGMTAAQKAERVLNVITEAVPDELSFKLVQTKEANMFDTYKFRSASKLVTRLNDVKSAAKTAFYNNVLGEAVAVVSEPEDIQQAKNEAKQDAELVATVIIEQIHGGAIAGATETWDVDRIVQELAIILEQYNPETPKGCCIVSSVTEIKYDNAILNHDDLLLKAFKKGGMKMVNLLIEMSQNKSVSDTLIEAMFEYGDTNVIEKIFMSMNNAQVIEAFIKKESNDMTSVYDLAILPLFDEDSGIHLNYIDIENIADEIDLVGNI